MSVCLVCASDVVVFKLKEPNLSVKLSATWTPLGKFDSQLAYSFCSEKIEAAPIRIGSIEAVQFIHYFNGVKYDKTHPISGLLVNGCLKGYLRIHEPFSSLEKPGEHSRIELLQQTPKRSVKYSLFNDGY